MRLSFLPILLLTILSPYSSFAIKDHTVRRSCEDFFNRVKSKTKTIEYPRLNTEWKEWGEKILKRNLTKMEGRALSDAYYIRYFYPTSIQMLEINAKKVRKDGLAGLVNFTDDDFKNLFLQERKWILNQAGFTDEEINLLLLGNTKYKNMFAKERDINESLRNNFNHIMGFFNSLDELPKEIQALYQPMDENREQLRESLESGELKEGVNLFIDYGVKLGRIVKIDKPDDITVQNLDGKLETLTNFRISPNVPIKAKKVGYYRIIDVALPEVSKLFSSIESTRRRVTIDELNLPQKKDLPLPPSLSYDPKYIAGWTQIQEGIAFAKAIRELDPLPNPYTTHIEWFVPQIPKFIENARQLLRQLERELNELPEERITARWSDYFHTHRSPDITEDFQKAFYQLERLEAQALQAVQDEQVTYSWWIEFNGNLLTRRWRTYLKKPHFINTIMKQFPILVVLPVIQADYKELGIMSINKAVQNRVAPLELISTLIREFDGHFGPPVVNYVHDLLHAEYISRDRIDEFHSSFPLREAEKTHVQFMNSLQLEDRIQMENIYFLTMHENVNTLDKINYIIFGMDLRDY